MYRQEKVFLKFKNEVIHIKIDEIDRNFKAESFEKDDMVFYNVKEKPFDLYGLCHAEIGKDFSRLPEDVAKNTSEGVLLLSKHTAGGRVRFTTDSKDIAVMVKRPNAWRMNHMPFTGSGGFDMYADGAFIGTYRPPIEDTTEFEGILHVEGENMHDIIINFPLYNDVSEVYVGIKKGSKLQAGLKYINDKPIVYYGSSITQGGCASRPGNSYQGMISRKLNCDYINLGFSGNAKGEKAIAEYIANLDMCCFVYDYDHNAPNPEYLKKTHEPMFKLVREKHPDIPIIMMNSPYRVNISPEQRTAIILETYNNAINSGDKNVYFIDMHKAVSIDEEDGTVDGYHPNDLGFRHMADALLEVIEKNVF